MSVCKEGAAFGQSIHVRRLNLGVSAEWSDPVVKIVDRDHQYIRSRGVGDGHEDQCGETSSESIHSRDGG